MKKRNIYNINFRFVSETSPGGAILQAVDGFASTIQSAIALLKAPAWVGMLARES